VCSTSSSARPRCRRSRAIWCGCRWGIPHAYYNNTGAATRALFWVSPAGRLKELFDRLHDLTDIEEAIRISALHEVEFVR
jgi:hypothetical protein